MINKIVNSVAYKFEFIGLTAGKNIRNKVFFCSFLGRKEPKELQKKATIAKRQKSRKAKSAEMNSLISVAFCFRDKAPSVPQV